MTRRILTPTLILLAVLTLAVSTVSASSRTSNLPAGTEGGTLVPGNYCVSCHLADDPRLADATAWKGSITRELNSPCPAATKIHEELYYTERLLLMIDRAEGSVGALPTKTQSRLDGYTQRYSRMLDTPVTSLDAFVSEAQTARYLMNKAYTALNDMAQAAKLRTVLIYAAIMTFIVLGSLAWGIYNTRAIKAGIVSKSWATFWRVVFVVAVLVFFALPIFRVPAAEVEMTTEEQQAAQTTLDTAQRAADAADRAQARAWMLARVGTAWSEASDEGAQSLLNEAVTALETAREDEEALWGQSLAVQEVSVGTEIEMEKADLIAADLNAARGRAWGLPLVAVEVNELDPAAAVALLEAEQKAIVNQACLYRDLQLRGLALAWAQVNLENAAPTAMQINDPSLRAWTFRELAVLTGDSVLFEDAAEAARAIDDSAQRARALSEIGQVSVEAALFDEALSALDSLNGAKLAYALSDLAAASGNMSLVEQIDPAYPDARASALLRMGAYESAWEAAADITDPYEQARAQAAIAATWGSEGGAAQISVPLYRDLALRDVIRKSGNGALVDSITSPYYKVGALTALGEYESAMQLADDLGDAYPLVELAVKLAESDPEAALALMDEMDREADKAVVLQAVAVASGDQELIERAQGMALAARVRGDSLAPVQASLDLAQALWMVNQNDAQAALQQAYEAAQRIAIK
jgi:hypothetical protein